MAENGAKPNGLCNGQQQQQQEEEQQRQQQPQTYDFSLEYGHFVDYAQAANASPHLGSPGITAHHHFGIIGDYGICPNTDLDMTQNGQPWPGFRATVDFLNRRDKPQGIQYKVLFFLRHAEASHNLAESLYGPECYWNNWAHWDGDRRLAWVDAKLTERGEYQAFLLQKA
ncbi:hypothetical protein P8C59_005747 [Phyllachora maydis]|uniref:Uncharacterized protein n=1 Tax=Phyllachora maydis TaxID=1825666 RepID=A0AAD9MFT3_9PEZI|nr:hypothetical protein P8C59_005747 [Phyllachora maydis]